MEAWFVLAWLAQVGLAIYAWRGLTEYPGMTQATRAMRRAAIAFGFIPCPGIGVIIQLIYIGIFKAREAVHARDQRAADARLETTFDTRPTGGTSLPGPSSATSNPFDDGPASGPQRQDPNRGPENNPFDDSPPSGPQRQDPNRGPENNPFG